MIVCDDIPTRGQNGVLHDKKKKFKFSYCLVQRLIFALPFYILFYFFYLFDCFYPFPIFYKFLFSFF